MVGSRREDALSDVEQRTVDRIERVIRPVLCETPSPGFVARARQRTAEQNVAAGWWQPWHAAAVLSAAMLLLAIVAFHDRQPNVVGRPHAERAAIVPVSTGHGSDSPMIGGASIVGQRVRLGRGAARTPPQRRPEVLVPRGQLDAIARFVESMRISPVDAQPLAIAADVPSAPDLSEIVIAPLKIEPLVRPAASLGLGGPGANR